MNPKVLGHFLDMTQFLVGLPAGGLLLKQLFDHILFNPALWIHCSVEVRFSFILNVRNTVKLCLKGHLYITNHCL